MSELISSTNKETIAETELASVLDMVESLADEEVLPLLEEERKKQGSR